MSVTGQLFFGGDIYTVDPARPSVEAVAVRAGTIVAVGALNKCRSILDDDYEPIDLQGAALLPGFIDTHLHPTTLIFYDQNVRLRGVTSLAELQARLQAQIRDHAPSAWIVGLDFDEQNLPEARLPSRHDLDLAGPDNPVILIKHDLHSIIGNTKAIEAAGASAATIDPEGGVIDREPDGYPAGPFREAASQLLLNVMPLPDVDSLIAGAKNTARNLAAHGITSIGGILQTGEQGPAGISGAFDVGIMSMLLEHFPINIYGMLIAADLEQISMARQSPLHQSVPGGHHIGAVKMFADGSFGTGTAYMHEPFDDLPDKRGFLVEDEESLYRRMLWVHQAGLQIAMHAIGDAANRAAVDLFERLLAEHPRADHRHRLEHASVVDRGTVADIARLGLVISTQPLFIHTEKGWLHKRLGAERAKRTYPFRAFLEAGIRVAGASDAPVESVDVLHAIQCCVTREGFEVQEAITAAEAVRMYTFDAAYAQFEEQVKGSISLGKRADLVVLSENPVSAKPSEIKRIQVLRTMAGGKTIYRLP